VGTRLREPEMLAALVNAVVVLCLPSIVVGIGVLRALKDPGYSWPVHPANWSPWLEAIRFFAGSAVFMSPFALLAAWRTWVHATHWRIGNRVRSLQGVVEAGACGLGVALLVLLPPTILRPTEAPPYLMTYGGLGLLVGLAVGLVLLVTAAAVLTMTGRTAA
jgi:hypothetical protein